MRKSWQKASFGIALVVFLTATGGALADVEAPGDVRDRLTVDEIFADAPNRNGPIHNNYFMPIGEAGPAHHDLEGELALSPSNIFAGGKRFPEFSAAFFSVDGYLVPVERDIVRSRSNEWDIVLSPGRVWSESGDNGWSRASFPFVLVGTPYGDSRNGLATFLFSDGDVSDLQLQIVQETTLGALSDFDAWLRIPMAYTPGQIDARSELAASFEDDLARRLPIQPLETLVSEVQLTEAMGRDLDELIVTGFLDDGVLYRSPCHTRFGDYPYCDEMRLEVYSVTKPATSALSLLWLAQKYGPGVFDLKIVDYVEVTADHDGWNDVTFRDAVNMATGVGDAAPEPIVDESGFWSDARHNFSQFASAATAEGKLEAAFSAGNYSWGPGEVMRYNNMHAFVLAVAMDAFLKSKEGPDANLWDWVTEEVLRPIGIPYAPLIHTREPNGSRGVPVMAYGFLPTIDDMAKIAGLLHDRGIHDGQQLLYGDEIDMLLQGDPDRGLPIHYWTKEFGLGSHDFAIWYTPLGTREGCVVRVPFMWGSGGNFLVLMPNGMTGIRLGVDNAADEREVENIAALADSLRSFCEP